MNNDIQHNPDGGFTVLMPLTSAPFRLPSSKKQRRPEDPGMYGVQTWSAGPIYPAIIRVEEYYSEWRKESHWNREEFYALPLSARLMHKRYVLTIPGYGHEQMFRTRDEAEALAVAMQGKVPS